MCFSFLKKTGQKCHFFCFCLARKVRGLIQSGDCFCILCAAPRGTILKLRRYLEPFKLASCYFVPFPQPSTNAHTVRHPSVKKHYVSSDFHNPAAWPTESEVSLSLTRCTSCFLVYMANVLSLSGSDAVFPLVILGKSPRCCLVKYTITLTNRIGRGWAERLVS